MMETKRYSGHIRVPKEVEYKVRSMQQMIFEQTGVRISQEYAVKMLLGPMPQKMVMRKKRGPGGREIDFLF